MAAAEAISFRVSYGLREYLSFVRENVPFALDAMAAEGKQHKGVTSRGVAPIVVAAATIAFLYKKHRMPVCDFVIDASEIRRTTRAGTLVFRWSDLIAVRRYSRGFLLDKGNSGVMMLPYRCFSPEQTSTMEGFIRDFESRR
jgi:hypothetical protein